MSTGAIIRRFGKLAATIALVATAGIPAAAETPPTAPLATRNVRISFLPPPLEGTISLGIYDSSGKLVRVLHRESDVEEFEVGSDALITHWDGNDDADKPLAAGKYHARGFAVGELAIEGIGFYFNDWISDERPERVEKICAIAAGADGVMVSARLKPNGTEMLICDNEGKIVATREEGEPVICDDDAAPADAGTAIASASGKDHTQWTIERAPDGGSEVKQYSATKELLRRLAIPANEPQPRRIAASADADRIFLLEQDAVSQRLRGLKLVSTSPAADHTDSDWKVEFENKITAHAQFTIRDGKPVVSGGDQPAEKLTVKLKPNPLQKNAVGTVELSVGYDAEGSFLRTADGLPLQTVSETTHLTRAVLVSHDAKSLDVFQDDGAVVEQFRIGDVDEMMAFDCGEIELK